MSDFGGLYEKIRSTLFFQDKAISNRDKIINDQNALIEKYDQVNIINKKNIEVLARNATILVEIINEMDDAFLELNKITGKYHPMIIKGEASEIDIKECSNICQRANKSFNRARDMKKLYLNICKDTETLTKTFDVVKGR